MTPIKATQPLLPLVLAALVIAGVAWKVRHHLGPDMPAAEWTLEKSWGRNLALIAGVISAVGGVVKVAVSMSLVVEVAGVIFTLFGTVAPLLYRATLHATPGKPEEQSGSVVGYLFASLITLWSAFGGILTGGILLRTLARKLREVEGDSLAAVVVILAVAIVLAVVLFSRQRLVQNIREQRGAATAPFQSAGTGPAQPSSGAGRHPMAPANPYPPEPTTLCPFPARLA